MTISVAQFRADYPEFGSTVTFPNSQVTYWLNFAYAMLNVERWGQQLDIGVELFTAHNITLEARAQEQSKNGGIPGSQTGPISSKSVSGVSVSYDTGAAIEPNAGHWNMTIYGTRFIRMVKMFGAGPIFVGIGAAPPLSGGAWAGPLTIPGFSNFS